MCPQVGCAIAGSIPLTVMDLSCSTIHNPQTTVVPLLETKKKQSCFTCSYFTDSVQWHDASKFRMSGQRGYRTPFTAVIVHAWIWFPLYWHVTPFSYVWSSILDIKEPTVKPVSQFLFLFYTWLQRPPYVKIIMENQSMHNVYWVSCPHNITGKCLSLLEMSGSD